MDIYLSVNNRAEVLRLPVLPPEFTVSKSRNNGTQVLKKISWSSFFPCRDYPFLRDRSDTAFGYLYTIDTWYERKLPIRLIITDTPINMAVTIDDFSYIIGRDGDMKYSITLSEVKLI